MSNYLVKRYKGKYRLKASFDLDTNQYPRKLNGQLEDIDVYIDCKHGTKIFHYGGSTLQAYFPSRIRGQNVVAMIINEHPDTTIFDIERTDSEVLFKFDAKDDETIIPLLKPKTSGAGISPFSPKNLPKTKYIIPDEDLVLYTNIVKKLPKTQMLCLVHITKKYLKGLQNKRNTAEVQKNDMLKKGLKGKEYIHSIGRWDEYIRYLKRELNL